MDDSNINYFGSAEFTREHTQKIHDYADLRLTGMQAERAMVQTFGKHLADIDMVWRAQALESNPTYRFILEQKLAALDIHEMFNMQKCVAAWKALIADPSTGGAVKAQAILHLQRMYGITTVAAAEATAKSDAADVIAGIRTAAKHK